MKTTRINYKIEIKSCQCVCGFDFFNYLSVGIWSFRKMFQPEVQMKIKNCLILGAIHVSECVCIFFSIETVTRTSIFCTQQEQYKLNIRFVRIVQTRKHKHTDSQTHAHLYKMMLLQFSSFREIMVHCHFHSICSISKIASNSKSVCE